MHRPHRWQASSHGDRIRADRCLPQDMQRLLERAPPARRIASCARSYVCFGPIIPVGFARERLGASLKIASYEQGGRAHLAQVLLARNKRRSERSSRCAARAALNLTGTKDAAATLARNHRISHRSTLGLEHGWACRGSLVSRWAAKQPPFTRLYRPVALSTPRHCSLCHMSSAFQAGAF